MLNEGKGRMDGRLPNNLHADDEVDISETASAPHTSRKGAQPADALPSTRNTNYEDDAFFGNDAMSGQVRTTYYDEFGNRVSADHYYVTQSSATELPSGESNNTAVDHISATDHGYAETDYAGTDDEVADHRNDGIPDANYTDTDYVTAERAADTYTEPGYDDAGYGEADEETDYANTGYTNAGYGEAGYEETSYEETGYGEAGYANASYEETGYGEAGYDEVDYGESSYDEAGYDETGYDETGYDDTYATADSSESLVVHKSARDAGAHYAEDRDYLEVLRDMQQGQWERVVPMLRALQSRYPNAAELDSLLQEATFRSSMESNWGDKVKGVQGFQLPIASIKKMAPVAVIIILLIAGVFFYGRIQRVNALSDQQQELLTQAQTALIAGQYREALDLFETVLSENPKSDAALKGQSETKRQMKLANDYQLALDRIASGNKQQALDLLAALQVEAPGYRDVAKLIEELKSATGASQLFADAEFAYTNKLWLSAIAQYEQLRELEPDYEADAVENRLSTAYLGAGQQIVSIRPSDTTMIKQAQNFFQQSLRLNPNETAAKTETQMLEAFMSAENMVQQGSYEQGARTLAEINTKRPGYFGSYVEELLFRAYIGLGEQAVQQGNLERAQEAYKRAIALGFDANGSAQQRLDEISSLINPAPAVVAAPVVSAPAVSAAPVEPAAPVDPLAQYQGWIAFRTNRNGGELFYMMKPDGSEQQPAPMELLSHLTDIYQQQQWSPDGQQRLYVQHVSEQASTNIFKVRADLPDTWDRDIMLTDYIGTEYDPVWSPDGRSIAFVSNHTGNDEIWVMDSEGGSHRQLTSNEWQWDKHPSFSPDGTQLTFYSNSSGTRQVWVMGIDGGNQKNISNNEYEDWDPVWIR